MNKTISILFLSGFIIIASSASRLSTGDKSRISNVQQKTNSVKRTKAESSVKSIKDPVSGQVIMMEAGKPVLQYNYNTVYEKKSIHKLVTNYYGTVPNDTTTKIPSIYAVPRSDYIHPLWGLQGEILTRDWSKDHPHHRGIYWAWPEVDFGDKRGDLHALQHVFARPTGKIKLQNGTEFSQIEAENIWFWENNTLIVQEVAIIRAYNSTKQGRIIDLSFRFLALRDSVSIARRETSHYGGLNIRMETPKEQKITFTNDSSGQVPQRSWSDLSGLFAGAVNTSGLMVMQYHKNPDYPGDWVQYPELSWCQPTFPAAGTRYRLIRGKPLVLRFRLFIHTGNQPEKEIADLLWNNFNTSSASLPIFSFPLVELRKQPYRIPNKNIYLNYTDNDKTIHHENN